MNLDELATKWGTDKGPCDNDYTPAYESYLEPYRQEALSLLELGVDEGRSLRMWREYLPNARIFGLDNHVKDEAKDIEGVHVYEGDQTDPHWLNAINAGRTFDVIIDDASHISSLTIKSFKGLWARLGTQGLYVIEGLRASYDPDRYGENEASRNPDDNHLTAMGWCKRLADELHAEEFSEKHQLGYRLESIQFFPGICFIVKA